MNTGIVLRPVQAVQQDLPELVGPRTSRRLMGTHRHVACALRSRSLHSAVVVGLVFLLVGCHQTPAPNFLDTLARNCRQGSAEACAMLNSVDADAEDADIAPPLHSPEIVQAILAGMRQSKQQANSFSQPSVEVPRETR